MKHSLLMILILSFFISNLPAQVKTKIYGQVTFTSSQYVYLKFKSTEGINIKDTLFSLSTNQPAAIAQFLSSTSVAAKPLIELKVGDSLYAFILFEKDTSLIAKDSITKNDSSFSQEISNSKLIQRESIKSKKYNLRMSIQSYGDVNDFENTNRYRYSFAYQKDEFLSDNIDVDLYFIVNYNQRKTFPRNDVRDFLKIYSASLDYRFNENHSIKIGRSLNPYIFAAGSIDGIQYLFNTGTNHLGCILGSRPNYTNYWFKPDLFQAGVFYNRVDSISSTSMDNSIAFIEQTNKFKPDRRFIYFQHRNDFIPSTNIFLSSEFDFFYVNKGTISKKINLSSLYSMINVRPHRIISFNLSYDSRRNVYFLESFKNSIDSLIENELRQGFRISTFIRPISLLFINLQYSQRETRKDQKSSNNYGATIGFNYLPIVKTNLSLSYYNYQTSFIDGKNYSIYLSKNLFDDVLMTGNFRLYEFTQVQSQRKFIDRFVELGLFINIIKNLSLSIDFEQKLNNEKSGYLMIDLTNRF